MALAREPLSELVERSADPERVRAALARLRERDPSLGERLEDGATAEALVAVLAASRRLGDLLVRDAGALTVLAAPASARLPDEDAPFAEVVAWSQREVLRLAALDLTGRQTLGETTAALSSAAVAVVRAALDRIPSPGEDRLAVIAMGKLGAEELNYASDIDLVLVGDGAPELLERRARAVVDLAREALRVDLDLRPEGRDGPLVRSLPSYEAYWERWAQPWERQALLKARPIAGDGELGQRWASTAADVVWGMPVTADDLRQVRSMKARTEAVVLAQGDAEREVKRAPGGIRDVEFAAQLLQLVHGPVDPELRAPATLDALAALEAGGYVDPVDSASLAEAYGFLRRVEHAVQLEDLRQTHRVPRDRDDRRRVARVLGFRGSPAAGPTDAFDEELAAVRRRVRSAHERVWFRPLLASLSGTGPLPEAVIVDRLAAFGFTDVARTRDAVAELTRGLTRSSRMMQQLLPLLLDWLSAAPDPDLGLLGLRRLASGERRSNELAGAFRDSPEVARNLATVLGTSRALGDTLVANPDLIERLGAPGRLQMKGWDALRGSAHDGIAWRAEQDDRRRTLQRWTQRHVFGIAARDVLEAAPVDEVGRDLARLAEAVLDGALAALRPEVPIAVLAVGRFGGAELGYASDLDLVFVHEGSEPLHAVEADRIATSLLRFVGGETPAERIWTVDPSLRPEGRSGPLSRSLEGWVAYLDRWASTWERQAYLRARPVAGDPELGARLLQRLEDAVLGRPLTPDEEREVRRMKVRIEQERIPADQDPEFHLKLGRGSLADVEFTVQLLQLRHQVPGSNTLGALDALVDAGHLPLGEADALGEAYRFCERARNRAHLVVGAGDALPTRPEHATPLARSLGLTVGELREEYRRVTRRARRVVEERFYDRR